VTQVYQHGIESGVEIAQQKPSLIMIDSQTSRVDIPALTKAIESKLEYKPHVMFLMNLVTTDYPQITIQKCLN